MRLMIHLPAWALLVATVGAAPVYAQNQGAHGATPVARLEPRALGGRQLAELEAYIAAMLEKTSIPGAAVAIVQDGQVIYQNGFGVRTVGQPEPVTPETLMMIGSVTKPMTATMAAALVDEGLLQWETPVADLLPGFAVADPALTRAITVRDAFCACTGLPQRDIDFVLNSDEYSPRRLIESVADFPLAAPLGELFQYSNQMFAIGGYAATAAATGETDDLYDAYVHLMHEQVLDPLGMSRSTFALADLTASGNHAASHGRDVYGGHHPIALEDETSFVRSVAPAGALWSNATEMARFVQMELARGVAPDGTRVVSGENLEATWQSQVAIPDPAATAGLPPELVAMAQGYALGWLIGEYGGERLLTHSGETFGFSAQIAVLPGADFGLVILTNGPRADFFTLAVQFRALELLFEQPMAVDPMVAAALDAAEEQGAAFAGMLGDVDPAAVAPYLGTYASDTLGDVTVAFRDGKLILDVGEFRSELRLLLDESGAGAAYVMTDPPLAGQFPLLFGLDGGVPTLTAVDPSAGDQYTFTFSAPSAATPSP